MIEIISRFGVSPFGRAVAVEAAACGALGVVARGAASQSVAFALGVSRTQLFPALPGGLVFLFGVPRSRGEDLAELGRKAPGVPRW